MNTKNENIFEKATAGFFLLTIALWIGIQLSGHTTGNLNYTFSFVFGLIPLIGGFVGMLRAKLWGGLKSALGKAVFFISFGLLLWGLGETIWSYYNFFKHVPAPYPSLADLGFAPSIFFWILGTAFLAKATGAFFSLRKHGWAKAIVVLVPLLLLVVSYYLQVKLARGGVLVPAGETPLKTVLDLAYPLGDFLALTFAATVFVLSYQYFGGFYRRAVLCLLGGLATMYVGDLIFAYTTTKGTYFNADLGDLLLATGVYLITYGILAFATKPQLAAKGDA